jgi:hypothetical protein
MEDSIPLFIRQILPIPTFTVVAGVHVGNFVPGLINLAPGPAFKKIINQKEDHVYFTYLEKIMLFKCHMEPA